MITIQNRKVIAITTRSIISHATSFRERKLGSGCPDRSKSVPSSVDVKEASHGRVDSNLYSVVDLILQASTEFGYSRKEGEINGYVDKWCGLINKMDAGPNTWIKFVKHKIASFYASAQSAIGDRQQLPVTPKGLEEDNGLFLLGGRWSRWFGIFRRSKSLRYQEFITTILQGVKKGCPRASNEGLIQAMRETVAQLTGPVPTPKPVQSVRCKFNTRCEDIDILEDCRRTVRELFQGRTFPVEQFVGGFPSTSSTYYHSRSQYGAVSEVSEHLAKMLRKGTLVESWNPNVEKLFDYNVTRRYDESLGDSGLDDDGCNTSSTSVGVNIKYLESFQQFRRTAMEQLLSDAIDELPLVKPVALPEALKVRVITKGPALMGYVLAPLQKFMHDTLRRHPAFALVGTPVTEQLLIQRLGRLPKRMKWLSGDYKDATNGLLSAVSNVICDEICKVSILPCGLSEDVKLKICHLFRRSLTAHFIETEGGDYLPQTNGQLMGSITSFPILCIANAALCRRVIEEDTGKKCSLKSCKLLINGDDCIFPATGMGFTIWERLCHAYNMKPSVGKTYWSENFLNINSTTFTVPKPEDFYYYFKEVKYINYGLVLHKKRSGTMGTEDVFDKFCNFGQNSADLLRTLPDFCKESVYSQYIREFGKIAKTCNIKIPWYVPQRYGGVGIQPFGVRQGGEDKDRGPSKRDRRVCSLLRNDKILFPSFSKDQKWSVHRSVQDSFPTSEMTEDSSEYDKYYGIAVAAVFYTAVLTQNLGLIYADGNKRSTITLLRRAEKIWKKSLPKVDSREIDPWLSEPALYPQFNVVGVRQN